MGRKLFICDSEWVGEWLIVSEIAIAIAYPSFASMLLWQYNFL